DVLNEITIHDFSLLYPNRVVNLKKLFPYIPDELNRVLLHFSSGAEIFDLSKCKNLLARV
ncbi:MAG: serine/threonine protein kinase, partial [Dissulfurimicrobium sp.]